MCASLYTTLTTTITTKTTAQFVAVSADAHAIIKGGGMIDIATLFFKISCGIYRSTLIPCFISSHTII